MPDYVCERCEYSTGHKPSYMKHCGTEIHSLRETIFNLREIELKYKEQSNLLDEQARIIEDLKKQNEELKAISQKQTESYEHQLDNKDKVHHRRLLEEVKLTTRCADLEEQVRTLSEIAKKPITINNTNYKTVNKILNVISPEAIDYSSVSKYLTAEIASKGPETIAATVHNRLLMDDDGKPKVVCTDPSRNKFKIKDPLTGDIIDDLNLEQVTSNINDQIEYKQMKSECLKRAQIEALDGELPASLALEYMNNIRLRGKAGRKLKEKLRQHYVATAKVNFIE
jgi:hypothetical protein